MSGVRGKIMREGSRVRNSSVLYVGDRSTGAGKIVTVDRSMNFIYTKYSLWLVLCYCGFFVAI